MDISKEQKYAENILSIIVQRYGGIEDLVNIAIISLIGHPMFEKWLHHSIPSPEEKESFREVDHYVDMTRHAFKMVMGRIIDPKEFQTMLNKAKFGDYCLQMDKLLGENDYFICLKHVTKHGSVALYNGN